MKDPNPAKVDGDLDKLVEAVLAARKYATVTPTLVARLGATELAKGRRLKDAVKSTKSKLHQVAGAYQSTGIDYATLRSVLAEDHLAVETMRAACLRAMQQHASTKERIPILSEFYQQIFARTGQVSSILDLACGLNPLALPWMPLETGTRYMACDVYQDLVDLLNDFFEATHVTGEGWVCDLTSQSALPNADLIFLLKSIPCLEQIDQLAAQTLLSTLKARYVVVSFPLRTIGGRSKGMLATYQNRFHQLNQDLEWAVEELQFDSELVYICSL